MCKVPNKQGWTIACLEHSEKVPTGNSPFFAHLLFSKERLCDRFFLNGKKVLFEYL